MSLKKRTTRREDDFLGESFGTARRRLERQILYELVRLTGLKHCFVCSKMIKSWKELSIEHKVPWLDNSVELFWDLENIAFSHMACNRPHRKRNGSAALRKIGPEGTAWCSGTCKIFKPIDQFHKDRSRWSGTGTECKSCTKNRYNKSKMERCQSPA